MALRRVRASPWLGERAQGILLECPQHQGYTADPNFVEPYHERIRVP